MIDYRLLHQSKTSFWGTNKKIIIVFIALAFATVATGFYLLKYKNNDSKESTEQLISKLPPPQAVPEEWVQRYFGTTNINDPKVGGLFSDSDKDGLNNYQEYLYGADPTNKDTDGDGYFDGVEVAYGSDPLNASVTADQQTLEMNLRKSGVDIDRKEVDQEFGGYLNRDRKPQLDEFKKEQLVLAPETRDAAIEYYNKFQEASGYENIPATQALAEDIFIDRGLDEVNAFISKQQKVISDMLAIPVPPGLVDVHLTYLKMYDGFLAMGKFAKSVLEKGGTLEHGNFYPEIHYMSQLDPDLQQQKLNAFYKYQIPI